MTDAQRALRKLIGDGMYAVDPHAVAGAIVARAHVRASVARTGFHSDLKARPARSFRPDPGARLFGRQRSAAVPRGRH